MLRAFRSRHAHLLELRSVLEQEAYAQLRPFVRLSVLFQDDQADSVDGFIELFNEAVDLGYEMVEFNYETQSLIELAESALEDRAAGH